MPKIHCMTINRRIKLVATDLDGTILNDDKTISNLDLEMLKKLGEKDLVRVAATGRSLHKVKEVLLPDCPFDYIVFSSGGGVFDWNEKKLLMSEQFGKRISVEICRFLVDLKLNFFVFKPIPHNNLFLFHKAIDQCFEFENYLNRHDGDFSELDPDNYADFAGQFMSIIPGDEELFNSICIKLNSTFKGIKIIRTTSPVDKRFIWIEIFPETVSKGHGIRWLCNHLGISYYETAGIGNDFNDIDMLDFVGYPFILGNSPSVLHGKYPSVMATNNQSGFSFALESMIDKLL